MSLLDYLQILRRRWWLLGGTLVILPGLAVVLSLRQEAAYSAEAQVLLRHQDLSTALSGTPQASSSSVDAGRDAQTQSGLARVPIVARNTIAASGVDTSVTSFLQNSSVTSSPNSDLLTFEVEYRTASGATALVNAYAREFTSYREALDSAALQRARDEIDERLARLVASGEQGSPLYENLTNKREELSVLLALQTSRAAVVRTAESATKVRPKPLRDGLVAGALALVVGVALAFLLDALDARVRSASGIAERLRLPLLARLPKPPRELARRNELVMLSRPDSPEAEPFRVLRANLELVNAEAESSVLMVASAVQEEGKSTTVANLAIAAARAGRRVVLVDLDLRRGRIDQFFGVQGQPGLTDVARNDVILSDALVRIDVGRESSVRVGPSMSAGRSGSLSLLPAGPLPPNPGDFVGSDALGLIFSRLRLYGDLILVDAPPLLQAGDATAIAARVDGIIVIARSGARRTLLDELRETLDRLTTEQLGIVVTGDDSDVSRYGSYYSSQAQRDDHVAPRPRTAAAPAPEA